MAQQPRHARAPLFDRLVDLRPDLDREVPPARTVTRSGLRESVRRELERLINTRSPLAASDFGAPDRPPLTVVDYGMPELVSFSPANGDDRQRLARLITAAVNAFEPRLVDVRVHIDESATVGWGLEAHIDADLLFDGVAEPLSFPVVLRDGQGEVRVRER